LISNPNSEHKDIVEKIKRRLEGYITSTKFVMVMYNVHVDLLQKALEITPGKRSPTITSLDDGNFKSVSSLVAKKNANETMDELHDLGATDILVLQLTNTRM
jgi:ATP phosphoribosyltransferase